ncbi:MAG: glycosyltransferase family 2 protein [Empedobacter falsenii]
MISIVIPLYNKELYIKKTLEIVLSQTYQNFEIIIIDDGSTDNGPTIVKSFLDERIKLISKTNGGVSSARNLGIKNSSFEYIAFLDADDIWLNNHLEEINKLINDYGHEADVFTTNFAKKYKNGNIVINRTDIERGIINDYFEKVLKKGVIHTSCVCIRKKALLNINGFNNNISRGEDLDVWMRLNRIYKTAYSPMVTEHYLQDAVNNSRKKFPITKSIAFYIKKEDAISKSDLLYLKKMVLRKTVSLIYRERRLLDGFKYLWYKKNILF